MPKLAGHHGPRQLATAYLNAGTGRQHAGARRDGLVDGFVVHPPPLFLRPLRERRDRLGGEFIEEHRPLEELRLRLGRVTKAFEFLQHRCRAIST